MFSDSMLAAWFAIGLKCVTFRNFPPLFWKKEFSSTSLKTSRKQSGSIALYRQNYAPECGARSMNKWGEKGRGRRRIQADSPQSAEPNREAWSHNPEIAPELKLRVGRPTNWATQVLFGYFFKAVQLDIFN